MTESDVKAGINSFADYTYIDEYVTTNAFIGDDWASLSTQTKINYIITAQRRLNQLIWKGEKVVDTQPLEFPRKYPYLSSMSAYEYKIPDEIKRAQCELIVDWIDQSGNRELQKLQRINVKDVSVGSLDFSMELKGETLPENVIALIELFVDENQNLRNTPYMQRWERS